MTYSVPERLHVDRSESVIVHSSSLPWIPSPLPGVERRFLEREGGEVARATSIVRYAPGSSFSEHVHAKGEEYLVLEGTFSDHDGDFRTGAYVRNPPGTRHAPFTHEGCVIFVKLRQMAADDRDALAIRTRDAEATATRVPGVSQLMLHEIPGGERVAVEILAPGTSVTDRGDLGGEEILVVEGSLRYGEEDCEPGTWIRVPSGHERTMASAGGCRLWTKRGHLRASARAEA